MTLEEITKLANERYPILPNDCRMNRIRKLNQRNWFIERMVKEQEQQKHSKIDAR